LQHVEHDRVVIVEAARPLVSSEQILKIAKEPYPSVSYAVHPTDTVFYKGIVLDRRESYCLQVPQAFDTIKLRAAHQRTMMQNANDDTILMSECYGIEPRLLTGGFNLFKVTYPWDLDVLEVLQRRM